MKIWWIMAPIVFSPVVLAQTAAITQYCETGATRANVSSISSKNYQRGVIPSCTVQVYNTGTFVPATIYANSAGTPLINPFNAGTDGSFTFFAAINQAYDLVLYGGVPPNVYPQAKNIVGVWPSTQIISAPGVPAGPSFAVNFANNGATAFQGDSAITINPTTHTFTAPNVILTGLSGTSPVCPNGTGGALTTSGCATGTGNVIASPQYSLFYQPTGGSSATAQGDPNVTTDGSGHVTAAGVTVGSAVITPTITLQNGSGTFSSNLAATTAAASVNKVLYAGAAPYNVRCDGTTDNKSTSTNGGIGTGFVGVLADALTLAEPIQLPAGNCKTSTLPWSGQSMFGAGQILTFLTGMPGQDGPLEGPDPNGPATAAWPTQPSSFTYPQWASIHDMTIQVDTSVDLSAAPGFGNSAFPNRIAGTYGGTTPIPTAYGGPPAPGAIYICGGSLPSGSTSITSTCSNGGNIFNFAPSAMVVGQPITIAGAGTSGAAYTGTISAITSNNTVTVTPATSTTVASWTGTFGNPPTAPWYIGACDISVPNSDVNHQPGGVNHWYFSNLTLGATGTSPAWNGHTCGFFMQASSYDMHESHGTYVSTYGGHIETPATNTTFAGYAQSPDTSSYDDLNFSGLYIPVTTYGGAHRRWNGITLYTGNLFALGFWNFLTLDTASTNFFSEYYDEPLSFNQGEHARFSGTVDIKSGALMQGGGYGSFYTNFFTNGSTINAIDAAGLVINGNQNTFTNMGTLPLGVVDNGLGNSVSYGPVYSSASAFTRAVRAQPNTLSTDFLRGGNVNGDWYTSLSDMFLTPDIFNDTTVPFTIVNDPNAPLTGRYAAIPSTGFGIFHYLGSPIGLVAGSNFARTTGVFYVMAKALNTSTTMTMQLYTASPYSALVTLSCPLAVGTYSLCSGTYNASSVAVGNTIAITSSTSPATEADIAWMAAVPDMANLRATALTLGGTPFSIAAPTFGSVTTTGSITQTQANLLAASTNLNTVTACGTYNVNGGTNAPAGFTTTWVHLYVLCVDGTGLPNSGYTTQILVPALSTTNRMFIRSNVSGTWNAWTEITSQIPNAAILETSGTDLNTLTSCGFYDVLNPTNGPSYVGANWIHVQTICNDGAGGLPIAQQYTSQIATTATQATPHIFFRNNTGSSWSTWTQLDNQTSTIAHITISTGTTAVTGNTCTTNTAATMTGVATTNTFTVTPTTSTTAITGWGANGGLSFAFYPTANTFNWSVCNQTGLSITPGASVTWNVSAQ